MDLEGIHLEGATAWRIDGVNDPSKFFHSLSQLFTQAGAMLYIEGTEDDVAFELLASLQIVAKVKVAIGTVAPRPDFHHIALTAENIRAICDLIDGHSIGYPCWHLHIYEGQRVLLQWYDAWTDPLFLEANIPEELVFEFAKRIGGKARSVVWKSSTP